VTRISRRVAASTAILAAAVFLSGCGGSAQRAGAAALVGTTRISDTRLQQVVSRSLADPQAAQQVGTRTDDFSRQTLTRLINRVVLGRAATDAGVSVTEGQVDERLAQYENQAGGPDALRQQAAQNGVAAPDLRDFVRDVVLHDALGDKLTADLPVDATALQTAYDANIAQYDQVHAAHILVADSAQAQQLLTQVKADPGSFAPLAKQFSADTASKDAGGDLGFAGRGQFVKPFEDALFAAKPGDYLVVQSQYGFHVVHVIDHRITSLAQATPELRRQVLKSQVDARTNAAMDKAVKELGVTVNPRFGQYSGLEVVPAPDTVSSPGTTGSPSPPDDNPELGTPTPAPSPSPSAAG
jgi:parvulin-like peptidyl-prolyl isomerase